MARSLKALDELVGREPEIALEAIEDWVALPEGRPLRVYGNRTLSGRMMEHEHFVWLARLGVIVEGLKNVDDLRDAERSSRKPN